MIIAAPTRFGTIAQHCVFRDGLRVFIGGGMLGSASVEWINLLRPVADAYGHLGPGVVVEVGFAGLREEVGVVLLDESQTLEDVRDFFDGWIGGDFLL